MKKFMLIGLIILVGLMLLPTPSRSLSSSENQLFNQLNDVRTQNGLPPLLLNSILNNVATAHSEEMLAYGYFDHISAVDGSNPYQRVENSGYYSGYSGTKMVAENLGLTNPGINVAFMFQQWMGSPGHKANILNNVANEVGLGVVLGVYKGNPNTAVYTLVFAYHMRDENIISTLASSMSFKTASTSTFTLKSSVTQVSPIQSSSTKKSYISSLYTPTSSLQTIHIITPYLSSTTKFASSTVISLTTSTSTVSSTSFSSKTESVTITVSIKTFSALKSTSTTGSSTTPRTTQTLNFASTPASFKSSKKSVPVAAIPGFSPWSIIIGIFIALLLISIIRKRLPSSA